MRKALSTAAPFVTFALLLAVWQLAASGRAASLAELAPTPYEVWCALLELAHTGVLLPSVAASLGRFAVGYGLAIATAVPLGVLFGRYLLSWKAFDPLVQVLRPISPIAWFPLFSLWFGIGELPAVVIIFIAAFYPSLLATVAAVRNVDPAYLKVARNFGARPLRTLTQVIVPAAFPGITVGARIALGAGWIFLVAGEMLGVQSGLGFLIVDARNSLRTDLVVVAIVLIGLLGLILDRLIGVAEAAVRKSWGAS